MDILTIIAGLCISTAALAYLTHTDPKRRRVFGQPGYQRPRRVWSSLLVLSAPGIWLLISENGAGFAIWLGALTVIGWGVAATNPRRDSWLVEPGLRCPECSCRHEARSRRHRTHCPAGSTGRSTGGRDAENQTRAATLPSHRRRRFMAGTHKTKNNRPALRPSGRN